MTLRRESSATLLRSQADQLAPWVDGVQLTDNPYAWVQMSPSAGAALLSDSGVDVVPVLSCRDRNRSALRSELLGMAALGVKSIVLARGPRVPRDHALPAKTVFDLSGRELITLAKELPAYGNAANGFHIGTAANVFRPKQHWRAESLSARVSAGAGFAQTQLCFNASMLRDYMEGLRAIESLEDLPVLVSIAPLPSAETARWLKKNMAGSRIPAEVIARLEGASDPAREGVRICAGLMQEFSEIPGVAGVCVATTGDAKAIQESIEFSGLKG